MLADLSHLGVLTKEHAAEFRGRVLSLKFDTRPSLPVETQSGTFMPEELRVPLIEWALRRDAHPAAGLALLFLHLLAVPADVVDRALGKDLRSSLVAAGMLREEGSAIRSALRMVTADGVFIWCDDHAGGTEAVMTPGPTTGDLLAVMPRPISGSLLDVGTGPGSIALVAKRRGADRVVATDISERALELARFNAAFNDLSIEIRAGDMFAPVSGERFDWIVAQPPYVTRPSDEPGVTFLHGGPKGDELAFRYLEGLPKHLRPRGIALALFDSPVRPTESLPDRVRRTVGDHLDVVVFNEVGLGPDRQALGYAALTDPSFGPRYRESAVRYREHLERERIDEVTHSMVIARASESAEHEGWTMSLVVPRFPDRWDEARAFIRGIDIAVAGEDALANARVRPREGALMNIERAPGSSRDAELRSIHFASPSVAVDRELTQAGAVIFDLLAAESSVTSAIERFARAMERPVSEVRPIVTAFVRDCLMRALLVPD
jgi:methylase of polypeptide subunit release factors